MKIMNIIQDSIVDGEGLRTVVFLAGCPHRCFGCHNPASWNMSNGTEMTVDQVAEIVLSNPLNNVTLSGGEPFMQADELLQLAQKIKEMGKNIWCYTGYTFEEVQSYPVLNYIDTLVDGKFVMDLKDLDLWYKGSSNQRIIDVPQSLEYGSCRLMSAYAI